MADAAVKGAHIKSKLSSRFGRLPYRQLYEAELEEILNTRKRLKITTDSLTDVTPKLLEINSYNASKFRRLNKNVEGRMINAGIAPSRESIQSQSTASRVSSMRIKLGGLRLSLEDIITNVGSVQNLFDSANEVDIFSNFDSIDYTEHKHPFIKITLRTTDCFLLYESSSVTEPKGTTLGDIVEEDNKIYDYLTIGRGMVRRCSDAETQTVAVLMKSRFVNTFYRVYKEKAAYASFFDVYDTHETLAKEKPVDELRPSEVYDSPIHIKEQFSQICQSEKFNFSSMVIERCLASNIYKDGQLRFRNFLVRNRAETIAEYRYKPNILFTLRAPFLQISRNAGIKRRAVSDISFCYSNGDIFAVAYGIFSYSALITVTTGNVCIWNIKNPQNPERSYSYNTPVTAVAFSPFLPSLLAVGMYDGSVEIRNITNTGGPPIAVTQHNTSTNRQPVIAIRWFKQPQDNSEADSMLILSANGEVWKYCVIRSPFLLCFKQMVLQRVEGEPEGLSIEPPVSRNEWFANRHPLGLNITLHPVHKDIYYLLTDEGCVYKCSTNHSLSYLESWRTHDGAVNCMDFSPWSPKVFITCGNDWCIRIWMEGIFQPLITLKHKMFPIYAAHWSRTHSTIIVSINRKSVDIWDIQRNILTPISRTKIDTSFNTMFKYSPRGYSVAIGNERGDVFVCALENMPFPPHFQYEELRNALFGAISSFPDLVIQLNGVGYFGYSRKFSLVQKLRK